MWYFIDNSAELYESTLLKLDSFNIKDKLVDI